MNNYIVAHIPTTQVNQRPCIPMVAKYITIHSTANLYSTAKNERDNLARVGNTVQASFHLVVDENDVYECIPFDEVARHAGDGIGPGNMQSIAIEICESGDRAKTLENAATLVAELLKKFGWGIAQLRQHYDWSGKNCPRILRTGDNWQKFLDSIEGKMIMSSMSNENIHWAQESIDWCIEKGYFEKSDDFRPDDPLLRCEMAVILKRIFDK